MVAVHNPTINKFKVIANRSWEKELIRYYLPIVVKTLKLNIEKYVTDNKICN